MIIQEDYYTSKIDLSTLKLANNVAIISGIVTTKPEYDHEVNGRKKFYKMIVSSKRKSGNIDHIPVIIKEGLGEFQEGQYVVVYGEFRSYDKHDITGNHLLLFVFAKGITIMDEHPVKDKNYVCLNGYVCKDTIYRTTPLGRHITDVLIAVNRNYFISDYIPCIMWGTNAMFAENLKISQNIQILGRIQSRPYTKNNEIKEAYEVSVLEFKQMN